MPTVSELLTLALQHHQAGDLSRAANLYAQILQQEPQCADALHLLGMVAHQVGRQQTALDLLRKAIALDGSNPVYLSNLGVVQRAVGDLAGAAESYRRALQLQPDSFEAHTNLGAVLAEQNQRREAEDHYRAALRLRPDSALVHNNLGNLLKEEGLWDEAEACYREALRLQPDFALAFNNLGTIQRQQGLWTAAETSFREAVRFKPDFVEAHNHLGNLLKDQQRWEEASVAYQEVASRKPDQVEAHYYLGSVWLALKKPEEAAACFQKAVQLRPNFAEAHCDRGVALLQMGRFSEAAACCREAVRLKPDFAVAHNNLGTALLDLGEYAEAEACFREALRLKPDFVEAYSNWGMALMEQGDLDGAETCLQEALRLKPDYAPARDHWIVSLPERGRLQETIAYYRRTLEAQPHRADVHDSLLYYLSHDPDLDPAELFAEHRRWGQLHGQPTDEEGEKRRRGEGEKGRKGNGAPGASATGEALRTPHSSGLQPKAYSLKPVLRIGYVSPDLRNHPAMCFFEPILANHDPDRIEAICYAEVKQPDATTAKLQTLAHGWRWTCGRSDEEVAEMVRADGIDILVDLAGHTANHRLMVFARKPAPVQATYLGYPATSGLAQMDYKLTDGILDPPGEVEGQRWYTEDLARLPGGVCCYKPPVNAPEVTPLPARETGHLTFGSMHRLVKLNAKVFDLWAAVLRAVPESRLLVFRHTLRGSAREWVRQAFRERGIAEERLDLRHVDRPHGYMAVYGKIDVCLDVFPWSGGTTTCEALWMGVPTLTLNAGLHAARMAAGMLNCVGLLEEWAAPTPEEYISLAVRWAKDRDRLAALRAGLRDRMRATICDGKRFTRELEDVYREMWKRHVGA